MKCPICDGTLSNLNNTILHHNVLSTSKGFIYLGPTEMGIINCLLFWPAGATKETLILRTYGEDGGPLSANSTIKATICKLRKKLDKIDLKIVNVGGFAPGDHLYVLSEKKQL